MRHLPEISGPVLTSPSFAGASALSRPCTATCGQRNSPHRTARTLGPFSPAPSQRAGLAPLARDATPSYYFGYPTVCARRIFCSGRRFSFGANCSLGTIPPTTVFSASAPTLRVLPIGYTCTASLSRRKRPPWAPSLPNLFATPSRSQPNHPIGGRCSRLSPPAGRYRSPQDQPLPRGGLRRDGNLPRRERNWA